MKIKNFTLLLILLTPKLGFCQQLIYGNFIGLYTINLDNCTVNQINNTRYMLDIAVTPNGNLYGLVDSALWSINTITGESIRIGSANFNNDENSLVALNNNTLLTESNDYLCTINTSNAVISPIGVIGYSAAGDLTWYDNNLYMSSEEGLLIKIVLNDTNTAVLSSNPVNSLDNPIPICNAMTTAHFDGLDDALIGFSGNNIYKICPIDGNYELLCASIGIFDGADTIRLPNQINPPVDCDQILSVPENKGTNVTIHNNPLKLSDVLQIHISINSNEKVKVYLYDLQGHLVFSDFQLPLENNIIIDLSKSNITKGVYVIKVISEKSSDNLKLIIE